MILSKGSPLPTVFAIFGAFWVFVVVLLYFVVGALLRKAEKSPKH